ncbi:MAG: phytoene desaturase [Rubrivivax sp.]|nr:phytoene desaturase [Rubrivivax sp.]
MAEAAALPRPGAGGAAHRVVVVGAGMGGLVAALLLACRGLKVTLVEAQATPGGKMRRQWVDGAPIDGGPTVFTMRWVFDEILSAAGSSLQDLVSLKPLQVLARHAWRDHEAGLDLHADRQQSADAIGAFAGADAARRYLGFCEEAGRIYRRLEGPHIRSQRPGLFKMVADLGPGGLAELVALGPMATLWRTLGRHFTDPRLRQLFGRYATYCGGSPWLAPATLMLVAHVEQEGVWSVDGGMHELALALAQLATARGADIRYSTPVQRIVVQGGRAVGVQLRNGETLAADSVVFNGDVNALATGLLGDELLGAAPPTPVHKRSLSAVTWAVHARTSGFPLVRHNVFFESDYKAEFDDIFERRRLPQRGTVYVCAQDRSDDAADPGAPERLLCLVNAPAEGDRRPFGPEETDLCQSQALDLMRQCGLQLHTTPQQVQTSTPALFESLFPATGGALYGPATHGWMMLFKRASALSRLPGLYLAGGSVHPGPGVPMAAMSGRLVAETLLAHLDSTSRSHRVATSGGTSTPSVTTAGTG